MPSSILNDTKKALGLGEDYTAFDQDIIMHINSVLADVTQLGIGPSEGYEIVNDQDTWDELIGVEKRYNGIKTYLYNRVRLVFDPPQTGHALTSLKEVIEKAEWRLNSAREEIDHPAPTPDPAPDLLEDGFSQGYITSY